MGSGATEFQCIKTIAPIKSQIKIVNTVQLVNVVAVNLSSIVTKVAQFFLNDLSNLEQANRLQLVQVNGFPVPRIL